MGSSGSQARRRSQNETRFARTPASPWPPQNLVDPHKTLDHFYQALLQGGPVRVLHYGDSPTTGDLITSDARALFQKQFGDGGAGFVLIAKPWAWYFHRGVDMDSSKWTIDVAGDTQIKDGLHGLGGASFQGSPGAVATFTVKDGQRTAEVAYLEQPEGGTFSFEADGTELGKGRDGGRGTASGLEIV